MLWLYPENYEKTSLKNLDAIETPSALFYTNSHYLYTFIVLRMSSHE